MHDAGDARAGESRGSLESEDFLNANGNDRRSGGAILNFELAAAGGLEVAGGLSPYQLLLRVSELRA